MAETAFVSRVFCMFDKNLDVVWSQVYTNSSTLTLDLDLDSVYTVTTVETGNHGQFNDIPAPTSFPLPYTDNFQSKLILKLEFAWLLMLMLLFRVQVLVRARHFASLSNSFYYVASVIYLLKRSAFKLNIHLNPFRTKCAFFFYFYEDYNESQEPDYLSPQIGSWEIIIDSDNTKIARQTVLYRPVAWCGQSSYMPLALIGDVSWYELKYILLIYICKSWFFLYISKDWFKCNCYSENSRSKWYWQRVHRFASTSWRLHLVRCQRIVFVAEQNRRHLSNYYRHK